MKQIIDTGIAPSSAPINDCVRAGNHVWLCTIAEDPVTGDITQGGIEEQARQALKNLDQAIRAAGGTLQDIVICQVFLTDRADGPGMTKVYGEFFTSNYPVRATVVVKELMSPDLRIEIVAQAWIAG